MLFELFHKFLFQKENVIALNHLIPVDVMHIVIVADATLAVHKWCVIHFQFVIRQHIFYLCFMHFCSFAAETELLKLAYLAGKFFYFAFAF